MNYGLKASDIAWRILEQIRRRIKDNIIATGTTASGRTQESMRIETNEEGAVLYGRENFHNLETGTPPLRAYAPANFQDIIKQWISDKGIFVDDLNLASYYISRKIITNGTMLYREGGRTDIFSNVITEELEKARTDLKVIEKKRILDELMSIG